MLKSGGLKLDLAVREATRDGALLELTYKEFELLRELMENAPGAMSRDELLQSVWGYDFIGETRTLDMHIGTLRHKLGDESTAPRYIKTVRGVGYRFLGEVEKRRVKGHEEKHSEKHGARIVRGPCVLPLLTAAIFDAKTTQQTETQLRSLATALGSAYDANGDADAQASQFSRQIGGLRVTVIAKDGTVLGDSAADYKTMENHAGREELKAAEGAGVGISVRPSETLGTRLMYAAVRTQGGIISVWPCSTTAFCGTL